MFPSIFPNAQNLIYDAPAVFFVLLQLHDQIVIIVYSPYKTRLQGFWLRLCYQCKILLPGLALVKMLCI